jgi:cell wall-associated NlpC family hydrolase
LELYVRRSPSYLARAVALAIQAAAPTVVAAQSDLSVGPFFGYQSTSASSTTVGGLSVLAGGAPFAIRGSAFTALGAQPLSPAGIRPWGIEGDGVLSFSAGSRLRGPYVFAGLGVAGRDSASQIVTSPNWSYGAGAILALGSSFDARLETRNTVNQLRWLNPAEGVRAVQQFRFGLSYHFAGNGARRSAGARPSSSARFPAPGGSTIPVGGARRTATAAAARVLSTGEDYLGVKYVYGGTSPTGGFDCSGFTQFVFARNNVKLPRTSRQQAQAGTVLATSWAAVAPGDLVMFAEPGEAISHVAIYAGDSRILHSTSSGGGVRYDDLTTTRGQWFAQNLVAARRVLSDGQGIVDFAKAFVGAGFVLDPPDRAPRGR